MHQHYNSCLNYTGGGVCVQEKKKLLYDLKQKHPDLLQPLETIVSIYSITKENQISLSTAASNQDHTS